MQSLRKTSPTTLIFMSISIVLIESFQSIEAFTPDFTPPAATYKTSVPSINKSMSLRQQCHTIRRRNYSKSSNDWITGVGVVPLAVTSNSDLDTTVEEIRLENEILKNKVQQLIVENEKLHLSLSETPATTAASQKLKIVLEQFEGESFYNDQEAKMALVTTAATEEGDLWCDELDGDSCPLEPNLSFAAALKDRAYWLVGLLAFQSCSGFILARNEALLQTHPVIIYFLTMLVGAGGNAGNQASVRVIRGLALGTLNDRTQNQFLNREFKMACSLSAILSIAGFARALLFRTPFAETIAITTALSCIVFTSICFGALLPLLLKRLGVDPAHSSTSIQVIMDILGVLFTVAISEAVLDSAAGKYFISMLIGGAGAVGI